MTTIATLAVKLIADAAGFTSVMDDAEKKASSWSSNMERFMRSAGQGMETIGKTIITGAAVVAGAAVAGLTVALKSSIDEAIEAQEIQAQLQAVLKSTGGIAGVTAEMVNNLADKYSGLTKFSDEAIISGENILLTFTNIGKDVFPLATTTMLDMSQALGQDLKSSAIQLGKALQDPVQGVSALQRVGVNFSEEQKKMIEEMVKSGRVMEAQKFILEELQREFGGSAEAAGKTFGGQLEILKNKIGNLKESIGMALLPSLQKILDTFISIANRPEVQEFLNSVVKKVDRFGRLIANAFGAVAAGGLLNLFNVFEDGSSYIGGFLELFGMSSEEAQSWAIKIRDAATWVINTIDAVATAFENDKGLIIAAVVAIGSTVAVAVWSAIAPMLPAIAVIAAIAAVVYLLYTAWTQNWGGIQEKTAAVWAWLQPILNNVWQWLSTNIPIAIQALSDFWTNKLVPAVQSAWSFIQNAIQAGMQFIEDLTGGKLGAMSEIWNNTFTFIQTYIQNFITFWQAIFAAFSAAANGDWYAFGENMRIAFDTMLKTIGALIQASWANIKTAVTALVTNVIEFFRTTNWGEVGTNIVQGIANGITSGLSWIVEAAKNAANAALEAAKGFLGIKSPSSVFEMQVGWQMAAGAALGWERGLDRMFPATMPGLSSAAVGVTGNPQSANAPISIGPIHVVIQGNADENNVRRGMSLGIGDALRAAGKA